MSIISKIVSGGQTGADMGALGAALYCEVPHGGYCPKGRKQEKGKRIPDEYLMTEMDSPDYLKRTEQNVMESDATLVFTLGSASGGSLRTIEYAHRHQKPWHHIDIDLESRERAVDQVVRWLRGEIAFDYDEYQAKPPAECVLNVAGSRESKADGIHDLVQAIMVDVLMAVNEDCQRFYPLGLKHPSYTLLKRQSSDVSLPIDLYVRPCTKTVSEDTGKKTVSHRSSLRDS